MDATPKPPTRIDDVQASDLMALTEREREVLYWLGCGLSREEIAREICRSAKTVDTHRSNIMEALNVHGGNATVKLALLGQRYASELRPAQPVNSIAKAK